MNSEAFNAATINTSVQDVTVRSYVSGSAYAFGSVGSRSQSRLVVTQVAQATGTLIARKAARNVSVFELQANRSGANSVGRRALVNSQAAVLTEHTPNKVILRMSVSALASAVANARVLRRDPSTLSAQAQATVSSRKGARQQMAATGTAQAEYIGRRLARPIVSVSASAQAQVTARAARRIAELEQALAVGFVGVNSTVIYPFDEPALEENTFLVGFENNLFYVR